MALQGGKSVGTPNLGKLAKKDIMTKEIPLELRQFNLKEEKDFGLVANYQISKPSNLPSIFQPLQVNWPKVRLDMKQPEDVFQFSIIQNVNHKNIIRMEAIKELSTGGRRSFAVFVEPHSGPLLLHLERLSLVDDNGMVPSQARRDVVRQIIDGVEELRLNGYYHGSLSGNNICYSNDGQEIIIKLVNFQKKEMQKELAQLQDWVAVGSFLHHISARAKLVQVQRPIFYGVIDDLAETLMALTDVGLLETVKKDTLNHPFFWDRRRRTKFFVDDIPKALRVAAFVTRVREYNGWQLPRKQNPHYGLIDAMDKHRTDVLKIRGYDGGDPVQNI